MWKIRAKIGIILVSYLKISFFKEPYKKIILIVPCQEPIVLRCYRTFSCHKLLRWMFFIFLPKSIRNRDLVQKWTSDCACSKNNSKVVEKLFSTKRQHNNWRNGMGDKWSLHNTHEKIVRLLPTLLTETSPCVIRRRNKYPMYFDRNKEYQKQRRFDK